MIEAYLSQLFEQHSVPCTIHNDWVMPNSVLPAIRALWYPGEASGELDVQVLVRENVVIEECFAGFGEGDTGLRDGLAIFALHSFHVLLAALWERNDPEHVLTEDWEVNGRRYTAYVGNFGRRIYKGAAPDIPSDLFPSIVETIQRESLTSDIHWFHFFLANLAGDYTYEAMKDNESWDAGVHCLKAAAWEPTDGYYSVRLFMVLRAA